MAAEDFPVDEGGHGQAIERVLKRFPHADADPILAYRENKIYLPLLE